MDVTNQGISAQNIQNIYLSEHAERAKPTHLTHACCKPGAYN